MANSEIVDIIVETTADTLHYMLPIIALLSGIMLILSFLFKVTIGAAKQ